MSNDCILSVLLLTNYFRDSHKVWVRKTWRVTWNNDIEPGVEARVIGLLTTITHVRHLTLRDTLIHDPKNTRPNFDRLSFQLNVLPLGDLACLAALGRCSHFFSRIETLKIRTWETFASERDFFCEMVLAFTNVRGLKIVEGVLPNRGPGLRALYYPAQSFLWRFGARVLETPLPELEKLSIKKTSLVCTSLSGILLAHRATLRKAKVSPSVFMTTAFGGENQELTQLLSQINAMPEGFSLSLKATKRGEVSHSRPPNYPEGLNLHLGDLKGAQSLAEWYISARARSVWHFVAGSGSGCDHNLVGPRPDGILARITMDFLQLAAIFAIGYVTLNHMPYASNDCSNRWLSYLRSNIMKLGSRWLFKWKTCA